MYILIAHRTSLNLNFVKIEENRNNDKLAQQKLDLETDAIVQTKKDEYNKKIQDATLRLESLKEQQKNEECEYKKELKLLDSDHITKLQQLKDAFSETVKLEQIRLENINTNAQVAQKQWDSNMKEILDLNSVEFHNIKNDFECKIEEQHDRQAVLRAERKHLLSNFERSNKVIERNGEALYVKRLSQFEIALQVDRQVNKRLKEENEIVKIKFNEIQRDINELDNTIMRYKTKEVELRNNSKSLQNKIESLKSLNYMKKSEVEEIFFQISSNNEKHVSLER